MEAIDWINILSIVVLGGFIIALGFLIALLWRANRVLYKIDHLNQTLQGFVRDIVPAIVNVGTIASAVQGVLRSVSEHLGEANKKENKEK
jgi:uncharacterized protein YoxC